MPYVYYNPNPNCKSVGDCVIRAIAKAINRDWEVGDNVENIRASAVGNFLTIQDECGIL